MTDHAGTDRAGTERGQAGRAPERAAHSLVAGFVVYLVLLAWVVLWKLEVPWLGESTERVVKLVPFARTESAGASDRFDVVVNLVLFVPFGVYLGLVARSWGWRRVSGVVAGASLALEVTQYVLAIGSTDVTDVVVNTVGGLVGFTLLASARRRLGVRTAGVMARVCAAGTVLTVLACALVVATPLRYAPPEDVRFSVPRATPALPPRS